jgi:hypothetical protein
VPGYASSISYHRSGLVYQVAHTNGVTFTQGADPFGMRRPGSIGVSGQAQAVARRSWRGTGAEQGGEECCGGGAGPLRSTSLVG